MQIWWFQVKFVTSYCADKVKFADGQTNKQMDRHRLQQYSFSLKGQGVKSPLAASAAKSKPDISVIYLRQFDVFQNDTPMVNTVESGYRAANLQNTSSLFCWKNFRIFYNFSVPLNLFLIRLKTVIMATSYLLWWDPLAPSGNSSGFFRYYRNRKWGRARVTTTFGREKNECFGD